MIFAAPRILFALALLVPVLVAFLVRRRRHTVRVPSTLLFRLAAKTTAPTRRIRWLRRVASLCACLLAVAALVIAAARPSPRTRGETTAIVIDVSASMGAGATGSPLAQARSFASRLVGGAGPGDRFLILAAGPLPVRLCGPLERGPELDEALAGLALERGGADREAALDLAADLLEGSLETRIVLLHDGGESLGDSGSKHRGIPVRERVFVPPARENLGVTGFAVRAPVDAASDEEREALIAVASSSDHARAARIIVSVEGREIVRRSVEIPARGEAEARVRVHASATRITARVEAEDGIADALAADDEASLTEASRPLPRVLLVGATKGDDAGGFFVEKAIQAAGVREIVDLDTSLVRRNGEGGAPLLPEPGDIVVALGAGPDRAIDVPALYLGTATGSLPVRGLGDLDGDRTRLRSIAASDALLRGVALDGLTIGHAKKAEVPSGARVLVELDGGSALLAGGAGRSAWIWAGIEPSASDMVLRVAFPVLIANALHALGGAPRLAVADTVALREVALRQATIEPGAAAIELEPDAPWRMGVSPAWVLAAIAALLLGLEAWTFRKGWAE